MSLTGLSSCMRVAESVLANIVGNHLSLVVQMELAATTVQQHGRRVAALCVLQRLLYTSHHSHLWRWRCNARLSSSIVVVPPPPARVNLMHRRCALKSLGGLLYHWQLLRKREQLHVWREKIVEGKAALRGCAAAMKAALRPVLRSVGRSRLRSSMYSWRSNWLLSTLRVLQQRLSAVLEENSILGVSRKLLVEQCASLRSQVGQLQLVSEGMREETERLQRTVEELLSGQNQHMIGPGMDEVETLWQCIFRQQAEILALQQQQKAT